MRIHAPSPEIRDFICKCLGGNLADFMEQMTMLGEYLYETNDQVNLTAIREDGFWNRHVADSLSVATQFPDLFTTGKYLADLGCGAGFPSLVLAAAFPQCRFTSIDSTRKKIDFVNNAAERLSLCNLTGIHGRSNELGRKEPYKQAYDAVFARAVAAADVLIRDGLCLLKKQGSLIVYRTPEQYEGEIPFLQKWKKGTFRGTDVFELPEQAGKRMFLQIKQIREIH